MLLFLTIYPIGLKGGEVFKFMATETENVCGDAAEATAELAANESEHPTPVDEVAAVEAAEEVPDEFGQQMGNAAQVEGLEKEGQDQEDAKSDPAKKAMLDQLDEDTPTNLGELKDYNPQNTAGEVTSVVGGEVGKVKQTFGKIEQDAKPMDTPDAVELKPVPSAKDTAKLALGQDAVPAIPEGTRSDVSFTSEAFSPKIARSSFSSGVSWKASPRSKWRWSTAVRLQRRNKGAPNSGKKSPMRLPRCRRVHASKPKPSNRRWTRRKILRARR